MELGVRALLVELMVETRTGRRGAGFSLAFKSETDSILADDLHFLRFPPYRLPRPFTRLGVS